MATTKYSIDYSRFNKIDFGTMDGDSDDKDIWDTWANGQRVDVGSGFYTEMASPAHEP